MLCSLATRVVVSFSALSAVVLLQNSIVHAASMAVADIHIAESQYVAEHPMDMNAAMMAGWQSQSVLALQRKMPFINVAVTGNSPTAELKQLTITLGPTKANAFSFDFATAVNVPAGVTYTTVGPNGMIGAVSGDTLTFNFTGLTVGKSITLQTDLVSDPVGAIMYPDYRYVLFDPYGNDASNNAHFVGTFADSSASATGAAYIQDFYLPVPGGPMTVRNNYLMDHVEAFPVVLDPNLVPEPSTFVLGGCGLVGMLGIVRQRRRKQTRVAG